MYVRVENGWWRVSVSVRMTKEANLQTNRTNTHISSLFLLFRAFLLPPLKFLWTEAAPSSSLRFSTIHERQARGGGEERTFSLSLDSLEQMCLLTPHTHTHIHTLD
jgi:hypothetical protein